MPVDDTSLESRDEYLNTHGGIVLKADTDVRVSWPRSNGEMYTEESRWWKAGEQPGDVPFNWHKLEAVTGRQIYVAHCVLTVPAGSFMGHGTYHLHSFVHQAQPSWFDHEGDVGPTTIKCPTGACSLASQAECDEYGQMPKFG
ncbi:hypothetical protein IAU60_001140 [Kwoniella sp. DSM 27419]